MPGPLHGFRIIDLTGVVSGPLRQARPAATFSATPVARFREAPALGEHNEELLAEAGCGRDEIARLAAEGVLVSQAGDAADPASPPA